MQCRISVTKVYYMAWVTWSQRNKVYAWISCGDARVQFWAAWSWIAFDTVSQSLYYMCI